MGDRDPCMFTVIHNIAETLFNQESLDKCYNIL